MKKNALWNEKDNLLHIKQGTAIVGKWNKQKYYVFKKIGAGMIGVVYLCRSNGKFVALKISEQATSITTEVNVLKSINQVRTNRVGPALLDVDDWQTKQGTTYSFYVMEYIKGDSIEHFIHRHGAEWVGVFLIQMLDHLEQLHQTGWVFGDLKNDNVLVEKKSREIKLIDVGGTTKVGRSVKEYSEFYDRAYWGLGNRRAEPSYDLFALAMVILRVFYPRQFKRANDNRHLLYKKIASVKPLHLYRSSLQKAIGGEFTRAREMKDDVMRMLIYRETVKKREPKRRRFHFFESFLILFITCMYGVITYFLF